MSTIRSAEPSDAGKLAALAERTFRDTFGGVNAIEDMNLHCKTSYGESIQAAEISNAEMVTLVCEEKGSLIAFAQLRWGKAPDCVSANRPGEIQRLYVLNAWHGKGIAKDLMAACMTQMEKRGSDVAWLGVWERNPRAISFYKKFKFVEVGDHIFSLGADPQRDIVMARPIGGSAGKRDDRN
ncbi:MAG: GNAT family N-acetyltransferase [Elusimicrobia bacterium]|nr:GNAT family N-acetyltransferase [Elusimicrobiota bacterium]